MSAERSRNQPGSQKDQNINKIKPAELAGEIDQLPEQEADFCDLGGASLTKADADRLSDIRFSVAQRQAMMSGLGRVAGNRYLQRVVNQMNKRGVTETDNNTAMRSPLDSIYSTNETARHGFHHLGTTAKLVQRWGAGEHVALGDVTGETIDIGGGVQLTFGQVVALAGDEFGSLEALRAATTTEAGRAMIRAHLERASIPGTAAASLPEPTEEQRSKASSEYITLAMDNSEHFVGGGTAVENWLSKHAQAIAEALQAGLRNDPSMLNQAMMAEAFGDHFLTDAFSSGHIRVPRAAIASYYVNTFAPRVFNHLLDFLRDRLVDDLYDQIEKQTSANELAWILGGIVGGLGVRYYMRRRIRNAINEELDTRFAAAGGRAQIIRYLGLGLAGIVSGAMHDVENRDGLMVVSDIHPDAWRAYGDDKLDESDRHKRRVEAAVLVGYNEVRRAYEIGLREGQRLFNVLPPDSVPETIYFGFDSDELTPAAAASVDMVAHYLQYNPATVVTIIGHADQVGSHSYNDTLSNARAQQAANRLLDLGIDPSRVVVESMGKRAPATDDPRQYHLNRRVGFSYSTSADVPDQSPEEVALENANQMVLDEIGPPYEGEAHLPRAAAGLNAELPEWRWGSLPPSFQTEMANWIKHYINEYATDAISDLEDITVDDYTVQPGPIAQALVNEILANPIGFLERAVGESAD